METTGTLIAPLILDGKYELGHRLGEGGMGVVYAGRHLDLHRRVAIKVIASPHESFADRFRVEAAALGRLKHPHIVDVMDFGVDRTSGMAYLVMELLDGITLAARCAQSPPLQRSEALHVLEQVADGIDFAHSQGILHRDLKPANIFITNSQTGDAIKILDFGLAQFWQAPGDTPADKPRATAHVIADPSDNATTALVAASEQGSIDVNRWRLDALQDNDRNFVMGTPSYMAPELFRFEPASPASDVYAFGVLAYQLLTGALPTATRSAVNEIPAPSTVNADTPRELDAPVMHLLAPEPEQRPSSARTALAAIIAADRDATLRDWRDCERPRRRLAAVGLGALAALGATLWSAPPLDRIERAAIDARFAMVSPHAPNPALLLVVLDDESVDAERRPLSLRADEFANGLNRVFDAGARAVAIDLLLPSTWAGSSPFAQLVARHPESVTLAAFSTDAGTVVGPECLPGLVTGLLGAERARQLFGFVNLDQDADGITRRLRLDYRAVDGAPQPTWAARAASTTGVALLADRTRHHIDYTADARRFPRVSWRNVTRLAETSPGTFRDRVVLLGAAFVGSGDAHLPIPGRGASEASLTGLELQALAVNTILDGFPIRQSRSWPIAAAAAAVCGVLAFLLLMKRRSTVALSLGLALAVAYVAVAFVVFASTRTLWPVAGPLVSVALTVGAALAARVAWGRPPLGV
jgi:CHASE2 domain-containing sensor protein